MDVGSLLIVVGVAALVIAFVARPLVGRAPPDERVEDRRLAALLAELDRVMAAIQELDTDHAMGKIETWDHQSQREDLVQRGVSLMKMRDEMQGRTQEPTTDAQDRVDAWIEAEVAKLRAGTRGEPSGYCGSCGQPAQSGDQFCIRCGAPVALEGTHR